MLTALEKNKDDIAATTEKTAKKSKFTALEAAILQTLAYFDVFSVPMTLGQITDYLAGGLAKETDIFTTLEELRDKKFIIRRANLYALYGQEEVFHDWILKTKNTKTLWKKIRRHSILFYLAPYIKSVMLCNNLPIGNVSNDSDIDILVVVQNGRMWLARLLLSGLLNLFDLRRTGKKIKGRYCLSFFVADKSLNIESIMMKPYDIYLAHWARQLIPLTGYKTYLEFQKTNSWANDYLPNFNDYYKKEAVPVSYIAYALRRLVEIFLEMTLLGKALDGLAKKWLYSRAITKKNKLGIEASIVISDQMQKFHNLDRRVYFRNQFELRLQRLGLL